MKEEKNSLRRLIRGYKNNQSDTDRLCASVKIFEALEQTDVFIQSQVVLLYWSMKDEVATHDFIMKWWQKKTILLPCVSGSELEIRTFAGMESMKEGALFKILEPVGDIYENRDDIDLIIVPGVAFDQAKNRLGRGRGYYDKLLQLAQMHKMGVCFDFQMVPNVPIEDHDVPLDSVICS